MGAAARSGLALLVTLILWGCPGDRPDSGGRVEADDDPRGTWEVSGPGDPDAVVARWLACTECEEGQLEAVVDLGPLAVPILSRILLDGPDAGVLQEYRRALEDQYDRITERATREGIGFGMTVEQFVAERLADLVAFQQTRAAHALGRIGGADARQGLEEALGGNARQDVLESVQDILDSM